MPLQFGVQDGVAEPQRIGLAPDQEVRLALEAHGVGRESLPGARSSQFYTDPANVLEKTKCGCAVLAASRRQRSILAAGDQTPPKLEPQTQVHLNHCRKDSRRRLLPSSKKQYVPIAIDRNGDCYANRPGGNTRFHRHRCPISGYWRWPIWARPVLAVHTDASE